MCRNNAECKKQEIMFNIDATYRGGPKFARILVVHHRWKSSGRLENVIYELAGRPFRHVQGRIKLVSLAFINMSVSY